MIEQIAGVALGLLLGLLLVWGIGRYAVWRDTERAMKERQEHSAYRRVFHARRIGLTSELPPVWKLDVETVAMAERHDHSHCFSCLYLDAQLPEWRQAWIEQNLPELTDPGNRASI